MDNTTEKYPTRSFDESDENLRFRIAQWRERNPDAIEPTTGTGSLFPTPEVAAAPEGGSGPANLRAGATIAPALKPGEEIVELSVGTAIMGLTYGRNVRMAQRICDGDASMWGVAMLSTCTTINGQGLTVEDFDLLPSKDATALFAAYNEKNG